MKLANIKISTVEVEDNMEENSIAVLETESDSKRLRAYSQEKLALAGDLRIIRQGLKALDRQEAEQKCGELMVKLAEDRFILAVLGQFKRGKSSLMNAIIGRDLLPTGLLPLTSAVTILKYGPTERLIVMRRDSKFPEELSLDELAAFVTEKGNPGNWKKVKTVEVQIPVPFLQRGLEFVDTPGVGSVITSNTETTYGFLPECDAVLFVTGVDTPMTSLELSFLHEIRQYVNKIFFVVNKIDLISDKEKDEILQFVTATIQNETGNDQVKVFPISSGSGLIARISGDLALYKKSGLQSLEDALATFLSSEKSVSFLAAIADKILRLLDQQTSEGVFEETALAIKAEQMKTEPSVTLQINPYIAASSIMQARGRIEILRSQILTGMFSLKRENNSLDALEVKDVEEQTSLAEAPYVITDHKEKSVETEIASDLQTRTCPVCRHLTIQASYFFSHWQYQLSSDEKAQTQFAKELGFCPLHAWQLLAISSPYGASIGYAKLAEEIAFQLNHKENIPDDNDIKFLVHNSSNCRVCKILRKAEAEYIGNLVKLIYDKQGRELYMNSQGVCLTHLSLLLNATSLPENRSFLRSQAIQKFIQDSEDMRGYAMKHDALRRGLQNKNEQDAHRRAIIRIVGDRSVCMPWSEDGEI